MRIGSESSGPAESGEICSVEVEKIAKKIAKNKRCYANTLRPRSRMLLNSGYVGCFHSGEVCGKVDEEASAAMGGTDV
jgi:hypothetical protein